MVVDLKYNGPFEVGMVLTAPDNEGKLGFRRIRLLAEHPDGGWIYEDLPSRMNRRRGLSDLGVCPEVSLRIVFEPEPTDG